MATKTQTDQRGKCRFCGQEQPVMKNDTLADHKLPSIDRRCFGSGMGPAK